MLLEEWYTFAWFHVELLCTRLKQLEKDRTHLDFMMTLHMKMVPF
jgi:hypothetical protein